ncbi:integrin alpha-6 isoform X2 [Oncorhynchus mykiss]|uniref:Integrin alpha-2 domain-containing protein n=1 Tax=Oncorhynchus mykiss TaxID=8022 RepID=A0A8C7TBF7_ONCMY|nr:integrin alpha-6 isoform X2 [Oncorhynchus mykiss]
MTIQWWGLLLEQWFLLSCLPFHILAFNLDTDTKHVLRKNGDPGSLFGFSLALHHQLNPVNKKLLLVGAPRAKSFTKIEVTGGIYQCELTTDSKSCERVKLDNDEFVKSKDVKDQWMGVRVTSQGPGQSVMTCAHRYQEWSTNPDTPNLVFGQCYILGEDLHKSDAHRIWRRVICDDRKHIKDKPKNPDWFGYCQQGHSAAFAKDNTSLLFGGPGAYQWKGIVRMESLDNLEVSNEEPCETGDVDRLDRDLIPLLNNSYLGFSIDSGMALTKKGQLTIVSGAPRGGFSGEVAFLKRDPLAERSLSVENILKGPGLASSFGYDIAVVDLNADGWDDLAVGAPEFFLKEGEVGGAVYIYINNRGRQWEKIEPVRLDGNKDSMFGLAVENIGDVNQDGYEDIAVGAPYDGVGRVYLYCGSSGGIHKKTAQIITAESYNVRRFGFSLTGKIDMDGNHYPDLAVGSLSDSIFVYRARPVVNIREDLQITPSTINMAAEHCDKHKCTFKARACFTYTAQPPSYNPRLTVNYAFEADAETRKQRRSSRMQFLFQSQGVLELAGQGKEKCTETQLKLLGDIKDRLHSIPISVSVSLLNDSKTESKSPLPALTPILSLYEQSTATSEVIFINKGCGSDNICQSNLELQYRFCSRPKLPRQDVFTPLPSERGIPVISAGDEDIALEVNVTNRGGDDAHQSHLIIKLPDSLSFSSLYFNHISEVLVKCNPNDNGTLTDCELGNPFKRDAEVTFYVILSTSRISLSTTDVNVTLQLETTSVQKIQASEAKAKVVFELHLQVFGLARPSQVSFGGAVKGESAMKSEDDIGTLVEYEFRIWNLGRPLKSFANASLNIYWPKENTVGKWLLYLVQIHSEGIQNVPCSPLKEISPVQHIKGSRDISRKRRDAHQEAFSSEDGFSFLSKKRKYKTLTCSDELKCVEIRCPLLGLDSTAVVFLQARLWNSTFLEDYSSLNYLDIVLDATLSLTDSAENIGLRKTEKSGTQVRLTVFPERKAAIWAKVAWWVIFLSVMVGLLLLALLGFLLWKCIKYPVAKKYYVMQKNTEERHPIRGDSSLGPTA